MSQSQLTPEESGRFSTATSLISYDTEEVAEKMEKLTKEELSSSTSLQATTAHLGQQFTIRQILAQKEEEIPHETESETKPTASRLSTELAPGMYSVKPFSILHFTFTENVFVHGGLNIGFTHDENEDIHFNAGAQSFFPMEASRVAHLLFNFWSQLERIKPWWLTGDSQCAHPSS